MDFFNFDREEENENIEIFEDEELDYDEELVEKLEELKEIIELILISFKK